MADPDDTDLTPDPLAPGPEEESARAIVWIVGDSTSTQHVRLYLDLEFRKSYEIPRDAITRRARLTAEQSPLGVESSMLWVRADTRLRQHERHPSLGKPAAAAAVRLWDEAAHGSGPFRVPLADRLAVTQAAMDALREHRLDYCDVTRID